MNIPEYEQALFYMLSGQFDDLLILMIRTKDDILSKKIHHFLNAYHYETSERAIIKSHDELLYYVDHAMKQLPTQAVYI